MRRHPTDFCVHRKVRRKQCRNGAVQGPRDHGPRDHGTTVCGRMCPLKTRNDAKLEPTRRSLGSTSSRAERGAGGCLLLAGQTTKPETRRPKSDPSSVADLLRRVEGNPKPEIRNPKADAAGSGGWSPRALELAGNDVFRDDDLSRPFRKCANISGGSFSRRLRCSLVTYRCGYAPRSRLVCAKNPSPPALAYL